MNSLVFLIQLDQKEVSSKDCSEILTISLM